MTPDLLPVVFVAVGAILLSLFAGLALYGASCVYAAFVRWSTERRARRAIVAYGLSLVRTPTDELDRRRRARHSGDAA
jgi:hypothetical protein